jgi:hypothetical protein
LHRTAAHASVEWLGYFQTNAFGAVAGFSSPQMRARVVWIFCSKRVISSRLART